ncbi:MAG: aminodeoxychorismate lyase [Chromatiaceae bacterium]|nr:MAG: aminodeoxychorismate lyase [Chromatiaceae bacterium]
MSSNPVCFSFFRYPAAYSPAAFVFMGFRRRFMDRQMPPGLIRLMGCGGGDGFSIVPDFRAYCLMTRLDDPADQAWLRRTRFYRAIAGPSSEQLHFTLRPLSGHGTWDGAPVFTYAGAQQPDQPFVVLTRARVTPRHTAAFWRSVPAIRRHLRETPGCRWHIGFGEHPLLTLATFSVWEDLAQMQAFAYRGTAHHQASRAARQEAWLTESLFVRFAIDAIEGDLQRHPRLVALQPAA